MGIFRSLETSRQQMQNVSYRDMGSGAQNLSSGRFTNANAVEVFDFFSFSFIRHCYFFL